MFYLAVILLLINMFIPYYIYHQHEKLSPFKDLQIGTTVTVDDFFYELKKESQFREKMKANDTFQTLGGIEVIDEGLGLVIHLLGADGEEYYAPTWAINKK